MWELRHRAVLSRLLAALDAAGVRVLLLKGTALAYDLYRSPAERSRGDSDVLILPADLSRAREVLEAQGFVHPKGDPGAIEEVRLQETWEKATPDGLLHEIDLHWAALNSQVLAGLLPFEAAWARARPLPGLGPCNQGLPLDFALLLACAHRAQHILNPYVVEGRLYYSGDRLIWLWDIDLLVRALDAEGWTALLRSGEEAGLAPVLLHGLEASTRYLGTTVSPEVLAQLAAKPAEGAAARYLLAGHRLERAWADLRAARGSGGRLAYLWGQLFPPEEFMRGRYADGPERSLLALHWRRISGFLRSRRDGRGEGRRDAPALGQDGLIHGQVGIDHPVGGEVLLEPEGRPSAHCAGRFGIVFQRPHGRSQRRGVGRRHDVACLPVAIDLRGARSDLASDQRTAEGRRLEQRDPKGLRTEMRRQDEGEGPVEEPPLVGLGDGTQEMKIAGPVAAAHRLDAIPLGSLAGYDHP
jgi:hypothetical protein